MLLRAPVSPLAYNGSPRPTHFMDNPSQLRIDVSRFVFFVDSSCRIDGLAHHNDRIDDHSVFSYYVYVVRIIVALSTTSPSNMLQNMFQTFFVHATIVLALRTMYQFLNIMMPLVLVSHLWKNKWLILSTVQHTYVINIRSHFLFTKKNKNSTVNLF